MRAFLHFKPVRGLVSVGLALCLVASAVGLSSAQAEAPSQREARVNASVDLASLMAAFRAMPGLEATYEEEKHLALLAAPLRSKGTMFYAPGGYLLRRVEGAGGASMVLTPRELRVVEAGKTQRFDLRARPDIAHFVQSFLWILSGDEAALNEHFEITFEAQTADTPWRLSLTPKDRNMAHIVRQIQVRGEGLFVQEVRVEEQSGDATVTRITNANAERRFSDAERRALFEGSAQ